MTTRIICLGNEMVCDDGVGIRVGRVLRELDLPAGVELELRRGVGLELLEELVPGLELVLVDATRTGAPAGTTSVLAVEDGADLARHPHCCHALGLAEVLEVVRRLRPDSQPRSVTLVGIEAAVLDRFGTELAPEVEDAVPEAVRMVLEIAGAAPELLAAGVAAARARRGFRPDVRDIIG